MVDRMIAIKTCFYRTKETMNHTLTHTKKRKNDDRKIFSFDLRPFANEKETKDTVENLNIKCNTICNAKFTADEKDPKECVALPRFAGYF
jgi:hypothetical protein